VVAVVDNAVDLAVTVAAHRPGLAVIDVRMPPTHTDEGIRAALRIRAEHPETAVLVFSEWVETEYARQLPAQHPAATGYLLKDRIVSTEQFIEVVRRARPAARPWIRRWSGNCSPRRRWTRGKAHRG
jgi:DNA-binding NarL/FixJ family response regulator